MSKIRENMTRSFLAGSNWQAAIDRQQLAGSNEGHPDLLLLGFVVKIACPALWQGDLMGSLDSHGDGSNSVEDVLLIQEAIGGGFGKVLGEDVGAGCHVGDGAGELYDAGAGAGGQTHVVYDPFEQNLAVVTQRAVFFDMLIVHGGVAEDPLTSKPFSLYFARGLHPCCNIRTRLGLFPFHQPFRVDLPKKQLHVDATK